MIAAEDVGGAWADAKFFGVADAAGEEGFVGAIVVEAEDFLALGGGFVGGVAAVADAGVEEFVGDKERAPPMPTGAGEGVVAEDINDFVGDSIGCAAGRARG